MKLYQHRTERDAFVTTVAVLAITTVLCTLAAWADEGVGDDMFVSGGYCACVDDGRSEYGVTETVGVA